VLDIKSDDVGKRDARGEGGGDDTARARSDDQVEGRADVERVDAPASCKRIRDFVEIGRRIRAAHAATIQAENAEWWQALDHGPSGERIWIGIVILTLGRD
jgi:hypothetical protein